jgi:hypothetical protein
MVGAWLRIRKFKLLPISLHNVDLFTGSETIVLVFPVLKDRMVAAMRAFPFPGVRCSSPRTTPRSPSYWIHCPRLRFVATIAMVEIGVRESRRLVKRRLKEQFFSKREVPKFLRMVTASKVLLELNLFPVISG